MAIKVLIKRRFQKASFNEISKTLSQLRYDAMNQDGYIASETMWDHDDPQKVVVSSMWQDVESWNQWKSSDKRKSDESEFEGLLDGPAEYEIYVLGLYPH